MKKLLIVVGLLLFVGSVMAQNFVSESFLTVKAIHLTNSIASNPGSVTNLNSLMYGYTNKAGMEFTNEYGTYVMVTNQYAVTNYNSFKNMFRDVPLWPDRNASAWNPGLTAYAGGTATNLYPDGWSTLSSPSTVNVAWRALMTTNEWGAAAGTNITVVMVGLPDGINEDTEESHGFTFSIPFLSANCAILRTGTATAQGVSVGYTNLPMYRFAGCKSIRVKRITGQTTPVGGVWLTDLTLNGFRP